MLVKGVRRFIIVFCTIVLVCTLVACTNQGDDCGDLAVNKDGSCVDVDTEAPIISGVHNVTYTIGDDAPDYLTGLSATDDVDGTITTNIEIDASSVDLTIEGVYTVTISVTDTAGHETTDTFTVTVSEAVPDYEALAAADIAEISLPQSVGLLDTSTSLDISYYGTNGTSFSWESSHPLVISESGFVLNPPVGSAVVDVTLTMTATNGTYTETKDYTISVAPYQEVSVTSSTTIPFVNLTDQYDVDDKSAVELFYVDNGALPYIDIDEYFDMLDGVFDSDAITLTPIGDDQLKVSYHPIIENFFLFYDSGENPDTSKEFWALFDFTENTVTFSSYAFFNKLATTDNPAESDDIEVVDVEFIDGDEFTIPLGEANFDILIHNDGTNDYYLIPLHVAQLLFESTLYFFSYYTPDRIIGQAVGFGVDNDSIITSTVNGDDIPYDIRTASYQLLLLSLDYFTSYKVYKNVTSYREKFASKAETLIGANKSLYYRNYATLIRQLDDLKIDAASNGYYTSNPEASVTFSASQGPKKTAYSNDYGSLYTKFETKHGPFVTAADKPTIRYIDNNKTAIFYFYEFTSTMSDQFKDGLEDLPSSVENVVVDVTLNWGGNVGGMYRMLGYMTNDNLFMHFVNQKDGMRLTYEISNSEKTYNYNWYILTSEVTVGAASIIAGIAREGDVATIIGQQSYGATSIPDVISLPCGFIYRMATHNAFATKTATDQYTITEYGVDVDYTVNDTTNDQQIIDAINEHQDN